MNPAPTVTPSPSAPASPASYTPKHLAQKILTSRAAVEGERKQVTVLFCDLANSTALAMRLGEERMHGLLNGFFALAMEAVHRYEGTINQFLGDGFMALFGAPLAHEDHARRAVLAALDIRHALAARKDNLMLPAGESLQVRMGLNTGPVIVGSIGDNLRMDYTAIGDTTHLAARLQQHAEPDWVLLSDSVAQLVEGYVTLEAVAPLKVKGKDEPLLAHRLLAAGTRRTRLAPERLLSPFVGREREARVLDDALTEVRAGHGQVVSIVGEPGVGKSRVLHELRTHLGAGITYIEGWCQSFGQTMPYLPMQDLLRARFAIAEEDSAEVVKQKIEADLLLFGLDTSRHTPYLLQLLGVKAGTEALTNMSPESIKGRTQETLLQLVLSRARNATVVLAIEDLHWIDKSSEDVLANLADNLSGAPILLVTTARPGYNPPWIGKSYATQLALRVLNADAARAIVEASVQRAPLNQSLTHAILDKAEGNPLFLEELALAATNQSSASAIQAMPNTIQGVLAARIDRLPESVKRTLQTASVLGREFGLELLNVMDHSGEDLAQHLALLKREEFVFERQAEGGAVYVFKHVLTQEVAYDGLLSAKRAALHERAAQAVERRGAERIEEHYEMLAHHYARSDNVEKAIEFLELANLKAIKANAGSDAQMHFEAAYALYDKLPNTRENQRRKIQTLVQQLPVYLLQFKLDLFENMLRDNEPIAITLNEPGLLGLIYGAMSHCDWFFGRFEIGLGNADRGAELCERGEIFAGAAHAHALRQWIPLCNGDFRQAVSQEVFALKCLERAPNLRFMLWSLTASAWSQIVMGEFESAIERCDRVMKAGQDASDPSIVCQCLWIIGMGHIYRGAYAEGVKFAQEAVTMGPTLADKGWAQIILGWALSEDSPKDAIAALEPLLEIFSAIHMPICIAWTGHALARAYLRANRLADAKNILVRNVEIASRTGMKYWDGVAHSALADLMSLEGAVDHQADAENHYRIAVDLLERCDAGPDLSRAQAGLGTLFLGQHRYADARSALEKAHAAFQRLGLLRESEQISVRVQSATRG